MTNASTGPVERALTDALAFQLQPTRLDVVNESHLHAGHAGDDGSGESHFRVVVESSLFVGKSRVERQRLVNRAAGDLIAPGGIHALAIRAIAPGEPA